MEPFARATAGSENLSGGVAFVLNFHEMNIYLKLFWRESRQRRAGMASRKKKKL